jgi:ATP-binding cassette subfamily B (MDR/TAP) protein 1
MLMKYSVLFSVTIAAAMMNSIAPNMITFTRAATTATEMFSLIDRQSKINALDTAGEIPPHVDGVIDIHGVSFSYPTRPDVNVLHNYSLHVPANKVTALVVRVPPLL